MYVSVFCSCVKFLDRFVDVVCGVGRLFGARLCGVGSWGVVFCVSGDVEGFVRRLCRLFGVSRVVVDSSVFEGVGGCVFGVGDGVVVLVSGGIDSPVAAWLLARCGFRVRVLHALVSDEGFRRVVEVVRVLREWCGGVGPDLYVYDHRMFLEHIWSRGSGRYTCVLCKRMMYRVAAELARSLGDSAIATGESLGQVASQTIHNLRVIDSAIDLPVLRPLIGLDKVEIERLARLIGTYEICAREAEKMACPYAPEKPVTRARLKDVLEVEKEVVGDVDELVRKCVSSLRKVEY